MKKRQLAIILLAIAFLSFLAYYNSLTNPFIWDDEGLVVKNTLIRGWGNCPKAFTNHLFYGALSGSNFYRPIQTITFIWDYSFWGLNPLGYHVTNLILQILVSFLTFLLVFTLAESLIIALSAALLFAVNPLHTEAVTYISGRSDLLLAVFILLSMLAFIKSQKSLSQKAGLFYLCSSLALFILALLSKELAVVFPFAILAYIFSYERESLKKINLVMRKILPFFVITIVYAILRVSIFSFSTAKPPGLAIYPLALRIMVLPKVFFSYIKLLVLPLNLHMSRTFHFSLTFWPLLGLWFLLGAVLVVFVYLFKNKQKYKTATFLGLWFLIFLLPQSGIIPINAFVAEHFIYLSSISFSALLSFVLLKYLKKTVFIISLAGLLIFYIMLTVSRNAQWKYPVVFYEELLKLSPYSFMAHNNLGLEFERRGQYEKAISQYKKAIEIMPDLLEAHSNLANLYYKTARFKDAEREYAIVEGAAPLSKKGEGASNIASLYEAEGLLDKAIDKYNLALRLDQRLNFTHFNLARIYLAKGDLNASTEELIKSIPGIGLSKGEKENYLQVIAGYLKSIKKQKAPAAFYNDLGVRFAVNGYFEAAIQAFKAAIELEPRYKDAYFNLGLAYYKMNQRNKAINELRSAVKFGHKRSAELLKEIIKK